jgi:hypothetical protein
MFPMVTTLSFSASLYDGRGSDVQRPVGWNMPTRHKGCDVAANIVLFNGEAW